jgi:Protein of unknown function (DUF4089)
MATAFATYAGLPHSPEYLPGIVQHLLAAHGMATEMLAYPLDDDAETAPVFRP